MPGIAFYCGSKFALQGISETLGEEVAGLGIEVTVPAPEQFRTDWAGRSMDRTPRCVTDDDTVMDPIFAARQAKSDNQSGDPDREAKALLKLIEAESPPIQLFLGEDVLGLVKQKLDAMKGELATRDSSFGSTETMRRAFSAIWVSARAPTANGFMVRHDRFR